MSAKTKMKAKAKPKAPKTKKITPTIRWFEIPTDDIDRAKNFYATLFGWKIQKFPGMSDYWHIDTGGPDDSPDGGMMKRQHPSQPITNYVAVPSVDDSSVKVLKLGGTICMPKTAVPQMGYFAICRDTENNMFALWEPDEKAK